MSPALDEVKKSLKENKLPYIVDTRHEQDLRRMLLNSSWYNAPARLLWLKRFSLDGLSASAVSVSFLSGVFLAFLVHTAFIGVNDATKTGNASAQLNEQPQELLQNLYRQGKIEFSGQDSDGTRIYILRTDDNTHLEIRDKSPYRFDVVRSSR